MFRRLLPVNQVHWLTSDIKVSHTPICSVVCSILCRQNKIHILQAMNTEEAWWWGYESVCFLAQYNFLHRCASLNKARAKRRCRLTLAANFTPGLGACKGRVQPFKHLHHVTAHPQFLVLELRAPMGTCPGQYDNCIMVHRCIKEASHRGAIIHVHKACRYIHVSWGTMRLLWQLWFYQNLSDTSPPS